MCPEHTPPPPPFRGGIAHDFGGGDVFQKVTISGVPPGQSRTVAFSFQWDEPFASASPASPGSTSDYDIYILLGDPPFGILGAGIDSNIGADPVEVAGVIYTGPTDVEINIMITKVAGPDAALMKYVRFGSSGVTVNEFDTMSATIYGHSNARGSEAVGAAFYQDTPVFGVDPPRIEFFSSAGTTPILFNRNGTRKTSPELRIKPGLVGPDGTNTTFFSPVHIEPDGFPNFFGTSSSAPHVAGVAAMMIEAAALGDDDDDDDDGGRLRPADVFNMLRDTAIDMDDPDTPGFDLGFDERTGFGFVDACAVLGQSCDGDDDDDDDDDDN